MVEVFKTKPLFKSNFEANEYRLIGNDYFRSKDWFYALYHYNKAIAFSETKDQESLGYANRSAVYFQVKMYDECLKNIQWARENDYPDDKASKLNEREEKCKKLMINAKSKNKDWWDFFKLSYPANEKIPWIVDCVEMRWTKKFGRGIYATRDLKAGDIIAIEEPVFNYTKEDYTYYNCYNCFKANFMNLIPCDRTASIMFCSTACKKDFYEKIIDMNEIAQADGKMLAEIAHFFGGVKNFDSYIKRTDLKSLKKTIFDYDFSNPDDPKYKENIMNCFLSLSTNKLDVELLSKIEKHVSKKTAHHILSIYFLNHKTACLFDGMDIKIYPGKYITLFTSLLNHSCIGNAHCFIVDNKVVTLMEKPVKAGEQIFECYTGCLLIYDPSIKKDLEDTHLFKCDCEACVRSSFMNWKEWDKMVKNAYRFDPRPIYEKNIERIKERLKKARDEINKNPEDNKYISNSLIYNATFMEAVGFQCTYPF